MREIGGVEYDSLNKKLHKKEQNDIADQANLKLVRYFTKK